MFFTTGGLVAGNGFIAHVSIKGRCLVEETGPDYVSFFGVNPGAVASDGADIDQAYRAFMERVRLVVFEIAEESGGFEEFERRVHQFVEHDTNKPNERDWNEAVEQVRSGQLDLPGFEKLKAENGEVKAEVKRVVGIRDDGSPQLDGEFVPSLNSDGEEARMAA